MTTEELLQRRFARSARALDFHDIREMLVSRCKTMGGAAVCKELVPAEKKRQAVSMLDETQQMISLLEDDLKLFPITVDDPTPLLEKVSLGKLPEKDDIKALLSFFSQLERLVEFREADFANVETLYAICDGLDPLEEVTGFFIATFDGAGEVKGDATARLVELGSRISTLRHRINEKADKFLSKDDMDEKLQDSYVSLRSGRVVLPIKSEYKNVFPGIIHGISATEKTAFMEPQELVKDNNELQEAVSEREEEVYRLLRRAAQMLREQKNAVTGNYEITARMDAVSARASLSVTFGGNRPRFNEDGSVSMTELRHPLMVARGEKPRPNSLSMKKDERTLVISGPNGGGKTVLLKAVGLAIVLTSCGIFPPLGAGSSFPFVRKIFALAGDEQSIAEGQSTFTAHLSGLKEALAEASAGAWVVVDEILHGTDPAQATVLAESILEFLAERGCRSFVSTHLPRLKVTAQDSGGMVNAAMGVGKDGRPTFALAKGHPGVSHPLGIAMEVGLPEEIIESAKKRLSSKEDRYQTALLDLQEKSAKLDAKLLDYDKREKEAETLKVELTEKLQEATRKNEEFEKEKNKNLRRELSRARTEMSGIIEQARAGDRKRKDEAAKKLREMENEMVVKARKRESVPIERLKEGDPVWIIPFDRKARFVRFAPEDNVEVISGKVRMTLSRGDIMGARNVADTQSVQKKGRTEPMADAEESSISLLGLTFDEALPLLEKFLDGHMLTDTQSVIVIHGKGVLKEKIAAYLADSPYVKSFSTAAPNRGGDGASLVLLRD
ncbi:MAG: Smr/MutS family protein [Nitrospinota bacterium]